MINNQINQLKGGYFCLKQGKKRLLMQIGIARRFVNSQASFPAVFALGKNGVTSM